MTKALAKEFGGRNICVNAVCPGFIERYVCMYVCMAISLCVYVSSKNMCVYVRMLIEYACLFMYIVLTYYLHTY